MGIGFLLEADWLLNNIMKCLLSLLGNVENQSKRDSRASGNYIYLLYPQVRRIHAQKTISVKRLVLKLLNTEILGIPPPGLLCQLYERSNAESVVRNWLPNLKG
jgi:hypothetical protein